MPKIDFSGWTFEEMKEMCLDCSEKCPIASPFLETDHQEQRFKLECGLFYTEKECMEYFILAPAYWEFGKTEEGT